MNIKLNIKLTENQANKLYNALNIAIQSYDGYSDEDLRFYDVKRDLLAWKQIQAKLDKIESIN